MKFSFQPSKAQLKVFSAVCSNLAAGWFAAIFITRNPVLLTADIVGVIVSSYLAVKAEEFSK